MNSPNLVFSNSNNFNNIVQGKNVPPSLKNVVYPAHIVNRNMKRNMTQNTPQNTHQPAFAYPQQIYNPAAAPIRYNVPSIYHNPNMPINTAPNVRRGCNCKGIV
jgi:hypothetical protein